MSIIACSVDECEKPSYVKKRQLCQQHYNRFMVYGDFAIERGASICQRCGGAMIRERKANGPPAKYCTEVCRKRAAYELRIASGAQAESYAKVRAAFRPKPVTERSCATCNSPFLAKRDDARFCSHRCSKLAHEDSTSKKCIQDECGRPVRAKGLCSMHWKRAHRASGLAPSEPWDERRRANSHKRRAQKLNLPADTIRPLDVYERDGWMCGICALPVDRSVTYPDPRSPSLDHVLPLSLGGHHTMENVTIAHLSCNVRKGNRVEVDAMSA